MLRELLPERGLPNAFGEYDEQPDDDRDARCASSPRAAWSTSSAAAAARRPSTSRHRRGACAALAPRARPPRPAARYTQFSGLEPLTIRPDSNFSMIGERTNVTGSREVRAADQERRLRRRRSSVARRAGRGGANILDVNMDEGMLDSEQAMTTFLNLIATEPEIARLPIMVDSSKWSVIEAGLKCVQGKGDRQLDQPEGRRGRTSCDKARSSGATARPSWSWRSTSRARPTRSSARSRSASAPTACSPSRSASHPPDIIFDPNILAVATGHRGAQRLRDQLHRGDALHQADAARASRSAAASATSRSPSAATTSSARRCTRRSSTTRSGPAWTWASSTPGSWPSTRRSRRICSSTSRTCIFNRRPDATERLVEFAEHGQGRRHEARASTWRGASGTVEERLSHALVHGIVDFIEPDVEEARQKYARPLRDHRRAADGRHEGRRRPVRRRQDVPAAGRQERPRDEEGGRLPAAVHGGGEAADRATASRPGQDPAGDRQGRRPRHRQEHRRRRARVQQLRGHRPRRDGPGGEDPGDGDRAEGRHRSG